MSKNGISPTSPAWDAVAVIPSDTQMLSYPCRALYIGGAGNVSGVTFEGNDVTFYGLVGGSILPVQFVQIQATGTTATNLVALY